MGGGKGDNAFPSLVKLTGSKLHNERMGGRHAYPLSISLACLDGSQTSSVLMMRL